MTALALLLFATCMVYWNFRPDVNFLLTKQHLVHRPLWRTVFYVHVLSGMLAIVSGALQFFPGLRQRFLSLHRIAGKTYAGAILLTGAPTGLYMAFYATGGAAASAGFVLMSVLWFYTTWMGVRTVRQGNIAAHRKWMLRSYAVTFSAVTLRLWVPLLSLFADWQPLTVVVVTAWISWLFNLLFIEFYIKLQPKKSKTMKSHHLKTAVTALACLLLFSAHRPHHTSRSGSGSEDYYEVYSYVREHICQPIGKELKGMQSEPAKQFSRCPSGYEPQFVAKTDSIKTDRIVSGKILLHRGCHGQYICHFKVCVSTGFAVVRSEDSKEYMSVEKWLAMKNEKRKTVVKS